MMFIVIIVGNLLGGGVAAVIQSLVSNSADARSQGQTMGAVAALNSLMAVIAPVVSASLLGIVSHLPKSDWRMGLPFYFCAALRLVGTLLVAWHFHRTLPTERHSDLRYCARSAISCGVRPSDRLTL